MPACSRGQFKRVVLVRNGVMRPSTKQLLALLVANGCRVACGDTVRHFDPPGTSPGRFPLVSSLLNNVGIGANNSESETVATAFRVPGSGEVDLTFNIQVDE